MPSRKGLETNPKDYVISGGTWPKGPLVEGAPPEAVVLQIISKKFRGMVEPRGEAKVAREAGISRQTVRNILRGETWIDLPTLYRIEQNLPVKLWTSDKWPKPKKP